MLTLEKLSESYENTHPQYTNPLRYYNFKDKELTRIKKDALRPYLECLEGKIVIYKERFISFVVLSNVTVNDRGFEAVVRALDTIYLPSYFQRDMEGRTWSVAGCWEGIGSSNGRVSCLYVNWAILPEDHLVKYIEKIYLEEGKVAATKAAINIFNR
jgi:hypothetical protein